MLQKLRIKFVAVIMLVSTVLLCCCLSLIYHYTALNMEAEQIQMMQSVNDSVGPGGFSPDAFRPNSRLHYFVFQIILRFVRMNFSNQEMSAYRRIWRYFQSADL